MWILFKPSQIDWLIYFKKLKAKFFLKYIVVDIRSQMDLLKMIPSMGCLYELGLIFSP